MSGQITRNCVLFVAAGLWIASCALPELHKVQESEPGGGSAGVPSEGAAPNPAAGTRPTGGEGGESAGVAGLTGNAGTGASAGAGLGSGGEDTGGAGGSGGMTGGSGGVTGGSGGMTGGSGGMTGGSGGSGGSCDYDWCGDVCVDLSSDIAHCGSCSNDCSQAIPPHMVVSACANGTCDYDCEDTYLDCANATADGCEIDGATDPDNCGACALTCSYGHCRDSNCVSPTTWGYPNFDTATFTAGANTFMCESISIGRPGTLAALGMRTITPGVPVRLGLYYSTNNLPGALIAATPSVTSVASDLTESLVSIPTALAAGSFWICLNAGANLQISASATTTSWWYAGSANGLELRDPAGSLTSTTAELAALYAQVLE